MLFTHPPHSSIKINKVYIKMGVKTVNEMYLEFQEIKKHIENLSEFDVLSGLVWNIQRKYLNLGKMIIITDLQYALRFMVEQELWNYGFKNFISILQKISKNEKNRSDAQFIFFNALNEANGFYLSLLDHFYLSYDLKVPFRRNKYMGIDSENHTKKNSDKNFKSLCYFICTHCLVHLGDLERYRNRIHDAELFYRHAQSVSPTSGHAYNQLALLDVIRSNKLGTVFHYVQAIMCQHAFGPSIHNLFRTLETVHDLNITNPYINLTQGELINIFLYFHKILHANANAQNRSGLVKFLNIRILAMVATNSFSYNKLLQMFVINLFSLDYLKLCPTNDCKSKLSGEQQKAKQDILKLIVGQLDAMLLTNYTITDTLICNNALPTIKLCFQWILSRSSILNEPAFTEQSKIWKGFCTVLNNLQIVLSNFENSSISVGYPLPEDVLLQGFSPLEDCLKNLNFTVSDHYQSMDSITEMYVRAQRLIRLGHLFTNHFVNGAPLIEHEGGQFVVYNDKAGDVVVPEVLDFTNETNQLDESQYTSSGCRIIPAGNLGSIGQERNDILRPEGSSGRSVDKMPTNDDPMKTEPNNPDSAEGEIRRTPRSYKNVAINSILNLQKNGQINEMTRDQDFDSGATACHSATKKNVKKRVCSLYDCMQHVACKNHVHTYSPLSSNNTNTCLNNPSNHTTCTKPNHSFTTHIQNPIALNHIDLEILTNGKHKVISTLDHCEKYFQQKNSISTFLCMISIYL